MLRLAFFGSLWSNEIDINEINDESYVFAVTARLLRARLLRPEGKKKREKFDGYSSVLYERL